MNKYTNIRYLVLGFIAIGFIVFSLVNLLKIKQKNNKDIKEHKHNLILGIVLFFATILAFFINE